MAGKYNLLLGAGISRDAKNRTGEKIKGAEELRVELCALKSLRGNSSLSRVTSYLTPEEREKYLTNAFNGCTAGPTANAITRFVWSQIFTLNIDDVLEDAYAYSKDRRQNALPVNYVHPWESFKHRREVPVVHLHGFVREPEAGYVFSVQEYAAAQRDLNPWMHLLSDLLRTEPFIVAGTSITEPDLEYYLAQRSKGAFMREAELSLLIEPYPDAGTEEDCLRFGLTLVKASLEEFLNWVEKEFGPAPTVTSLVVPAHTVSYGAVKPDPFDEIAFFSDFEMVVPMEPQNLPKKPNAFHWGRPPSWEDLAERRDVPLKEQLIFLDETRRWLDGPAKPHLFVGFGAPGAGKTTTLKRVALEISDFTSPVFYLRAKDAPDTAAAARTIKCMTGKVILCVDNFAERADNVQTLLDQIGPDAHVLVLGAERDYRKEHVDTVLSEEELVEPRIGSWTTEERLKLIENYRSLGLIGREQAIKNPREFLPEIQKNTVAESVCKILNDFRPLDRIVKSLWNDANPIVRDAYLVIALGHFCLPQGVRARIVASAIDNVSLQDLSNERCSLPVTTSPEEDDFVIPLNSTIGLQTVDLMAHEKPHLLLKAFVQLGGALAPFVTRRAIQQQTAEARLAGRLFDADKVVKPLLGALADDFYEAARERWQWNSRYWEQRALAVAQQDLRLAIQHARQAVAIEKHPYPMTTLANLLLMQCDQEQSAAAATTLFNEAFELLKNTIAREEASGRTRTKHAFWVLLRGAKRQMERNIEMTRRQSEFVRTVCTDVEKLFPNSRDLQEMVQQVKGLLVDVQSNPSEDSDK